MRRRIKRRYLINNYDLALVHLEDLQKLSVKNAGDEQAVVVSHYPEALLKLESWLNKCLIIHKKAVKTIYYKDLL